VVGQMEANKRTPWYAAGLHFECRGCGACCSGPAEGYIWVVKAEIERIAELLEITCEQLRRRYLRRVGVRMSIIEHGVTRDCIFLERIAGRKRCCIYAARPAQCRSWPFWPGNLMSPNTWNKAAQKCPGINRGRLYSFEEIEKIRKVRKWWQDTEPTGGCSTK
jgi:Fe-S-cluster containining protein